MANQLLRLTIHDPGIIKTLDSLRRARKQSAFVVAALRHYLGTLEGKEQLDVFLSQEKRTAAQSKPQTLPDRDKPEKPQANQRANLDDIFDL